MTEKLGQVPAQRSGTNRSISANHVPRLPLDLTRMFIIPNFHPTTDDEIKSTPVLSPTPAQALFRHWSVDLRRPQHRSRMHMPMEESPSPRTCPSSR
jgi:hypothetical protein